MADHVPWRENDGTSKFPPGGGMKIRDMKMRDLKMTDIYYKTYFVFTVTAKVSKIKS